MQLPDGFLKMLAGLGHEAFDSLPGHLSGESPVSVRVNRLKPATLPPDTEPVAWCNQGFYLRQRPQFTFDPALHQGRYYVQDASSMFIDRVIRRLTADGLPVRYLDACAAPGGKTTAALSALPEGSLVVANEYVATRAAVLRENIAKWGAPAVVLQGDTSRFAADGAVFDIIAADVPCSGEGMMRKDAKAVEQWSEQLIDECVGRQRQIVDNLWAALAPGGYLIYSTCTFNRRENEEMIDYMIKRFGALTVDVEIDPQWGIVPSLDSRFEAFRFVPGMVKGEGLFMAVVRKPSAADSPGDHSQGHGARQGRARRKTERPNKAKPATTEVRKWLVREADVELTVDDEGAVKARFATLWPNFPYRPELTVANIKGHDIIPTQQLAMSQWLDRQAFVRCEVDRPTAIDYLRAQSITLPADTPRGIVLLTFEDHPLGFVKNLGSRANNLYPKPWRILSTHLSDM